MKNSLCYLLLIVVSFYSKAQTKILFDATKAEMVSNADWIIDADTHNIFSVARLIYHTLVMVLGLLIHKEYQLQRNPELLQVHPKLIGMVHYLTGLLTVLNKDM